MFEPQQAADIREVRTEGDLYLLQPRVGGCEGGQFLVAGEGPALGVAILASVGAGIYSSVPEACGAIIKTDKVQTPKAENVPEYEKYYQLYREIYPALKAQYAKLATL